ncbi:hypothetical protein ACFL6S_30070 [Candidatus Poribacteria bacterium]
MKSIQETEIVRLSRSYLAASPDKKADLGTTLREYDGPIEPVIQELMVSQEKQWQQKTGVITAEHFTAPELREEYKDDLLYFYVPEEYDTTKPFGLLIFMHGGGKTTPRESAFRIINTPEEDRGSYNLRPYIQNIPFITVAPSAPWNEEVYKRWCVPEADDYISAVIRECHYRFNIDRDRVFLGGHSMGGFGAYHLCQRLSDRIAGGILSAGSWRVANWRCVIGTPLFINHGAHDAVAPGTPGKSSRPRYTDVFYARAAHKLLTEAGAEHIYAEYEGGHPLREAGESLIKLAEWMKTKRRDPFFPRVVAISPRGWHARSDLPAPHRHWLDASHDLPAPHHRWVSLLEIGEGKIAFDAAQETGPPREWDESSEDFGKQGFQIVEAMVEAGLVDAEYKGDNVFEIKTENVRKISIWLHPKMVDFTKSITVVLNGKKRTYEVGPTLLDALRSYERRRDWGLIYHCELLITDSM